MSKNNQISLKSSSILTVPIQNFGNDFSFVVNGEEFQTNRLVADLLSENICKIHSTDPTVSSFSINTKNQGDFTNILHLTDFKSISFPEKELPFILEVIEILGNNSLEISELLDFTEMTTDNIFLLIKKHKENEKIYSKQIEDDVSFISSKLFELLDQNEKELINLDIQTLQAIFDNPNLKITDEDQLLRFINKLYTKNSEYSILYESVLFTNASIESITEFVSSFDLNDITGGTWIRLTDRLTNKKKNIDPKIKRYNIFANLPFSEGLCFSGIIRHLKAISNNKIDEELSITSSSSDSSGRDAYNVIMYDRNDKCFCSFNVPNSWICFEFKKHSVVLSDIQIRSVKWGTNWNPKSWVVEGSVDGSIWDVIDEQKNCTCFINGDATHLFKIKNQQQKEYRFVRFKQTEPNWADSDHFSFKHIEFYGKLV